MQRIYIPERAGKYPRRARSGPPIGSRDRENIPPEIFPT